jgi:hypothetical protein
VFVYPVHVYATKGRFQPRRRVNRLDVVTADRRACYLRGCSFGAGRGERTLP